MCLPNGPCCKATIILAAAIIIVAFWFWFGGIVRGAIQVEGDNHGDAREAPEAVAWAFTAKPDCAWLPAMIVANQRESLCQAVPLRPWGRIPENPPSFPNRWESRDLCAAAGSNGFHGNRSNPLHRPRPGQGKWPVASSPVATTTPFKPGTGPKGSGGSRFALNRSVRQCFFRPFSRHV